MRQGFVARGLKSEPIRQIEGAEAFSAPLQSGMGVSLIAQIGSPLTESGFGLQTAQGQWGRSVPGIARIVARWSNFATYD